MNFQLKNYEQKLPLLFISPLVIIISYVIVLSSKRVRKSPFIFHDRFNQVIKTSYLILSDMSNYMGMM